MFGRAPPRILGCGHPYRRNDVYSWAVYFPAMESIQNYKLESLCVFELHLAQKLDHVCGHRSPLIARYAIDPRASRVRQCNEQLVRSLKCY